KLAQKHLGFDATLRAAGLDPAELTEVAELFRHPSVEGVPTPTFGPVDETAVERLLVDGHGFSGDRVRAAVSRARHRPPPASVPQVVHGHQTMLDGFGGAS
ncbi:MAG: hypothetical protein L3K19_02185, partial [Thermoplasmata archaeon]|nr:hypothetical protein [Thermoplasmata archaeon]